MSPLSLRSPIIGWFCLWGLAVRIEGACYYLRYLASCRIGERAEVWPVVHTRLARPAAWIAADDTTCRKSLDELVELVRRRHILERLAGAVFVIACCIGYNLGDLSAGSISGRAEVRPVVYARLARPTAHVSGHVAAPCKAFDPDIEGIAGRHILEGLTRDRFVIACRVRDHLGKLAACYLVVRAERAV